MHAAFMFGTVRGRISRKVLLMIAARLVCAALLFVPVTSSAFAKVRSPTDQDRLQAACYADVQRLCKDDIPDEDKIRLCMEGKKSQISTECTSAYNATQQ